MGEVRHYFTFGGRSSREFNVWISGTGVFDAPERDVSIVSVPGRNGDLTMDNGRFKNVKMTYPAFIPEDFEVNMAAFRAYMKSLIGYQRLEDTYCPDYYYKALLTEEFDPETTAYNKAATFDITFNRKPQRWFKSGEEFLDPITQNTTIFNPTMYDANPLIRVYGVGTFQIGDKSVEITENPVYTDIDCDMQDCYYNLTNLNGNVILSSGFPILRPGINGINIGTVTRLEIKPRWWTV